MWKFKSWKKKDKWLFVLTLGIIVCILAMPSGGGILPGSAGGQWGIGGVSRTGTLGVEAEGGTGVGTAEAEGSGAGGTGAGARGTGTTGASAGEGGVGGAGIGAGTKTGTGLGTAARVYDSYEQQLEARVREILRHVEGVGEIDVMIVLKSSGEKVLQVDGSSSRSVTEEKDTAGGMRSIENEEREQNTVLSSADGSNTPIIAKELRPELSGIIISAAGGGSPTVRAEISTAMEALFGLPPHKIKVLKRSSKNPLP